MPRPRASIGLALLLTLAAAGCGSSGSSSSSSSSSAAGPGSSTTSSSATVATSTTTVTASGSGTAVPHAASGGSACGPAQLHVGVGRQGGVAGAGHTGVVLLFRNVGGVTCSLYGYPGVAGLDGSGRQVAQARRTPSGYLGGVRSGAPPRVLLHPGGVASAIVEGTDVPQGNAAGCPTLRGLLVTAPNTRPSVRVNAAPGDCSGLEVHPVVPGASGSE